MSDERIERLRKRARQVRANALVRRWEYRQRNHAKGVWRRLRGVLCDAASAWRLSEQDALQLVAEGFQPEPVGEQLEPRKLIVFVPEERLARLPSRRPVPLRLEVELLQSRFLALVPWPGAAR